MDRLKGVAEARRAALAKALKRAAEAELLAKEKEVALNEKTKKASELQKRLELTQKSNKLMKDLLEALQKLDDTRGKLAIATEKAERFSRIVDQLHKDADTFEEKFQASKRNYNKLIAEMDNLGIN